MTNPTPKPGQLFKLVGDTSDRPTVFEAVEVVTETTVAGTDTVVKLKHPYVRAWELEGPRNKRYRRQTRSIAVGKVGAVLPPEPVKSWGER